MKKTSVIIPSRDERFLIPTIREVFKNRSGETECVAVIDSDKWPEGWKELTAEFPDLHTVYNGQSLGMRPSINCGVASAISRGAKYILKLDGHCMLGEAFDQILQSNHQPNWVQVPRRLRLDAENWCVYQDGRPPIDYHYLSFPDNPKDFGGPGLNGKVWTDRAKERFNKPEYDLDPEMSSQGSSWYMTCDYFQELELMDSVNYSTFWAEMQEIGLKCWLSGGQLMVNKKTWYAHLHKGSKYGRGYHLEKSLLNQGATFTKRWLFNEAWAKQTLPFKTLIERFWPVPTWPENWEELVYGTKVASIALGAGLDDVGSGDSRNNVDSQSHSLLTIHSAHYGINNLADADAIDVTYHLRSLVQNGSLDVVVTNDSLKVGNPFRGQKKRLRVVYSYDGGEEVTVEREERDWLIIGQSARYVKQSSEQVNRTKFQGKATELAMDIDHEATAALYSKTVPDVVIGKTEGKETFTADGFVKPSSVALNDWLIRRLNIPSHRLRGPMPIEVPTFHRNDLAQLFAELGFNRGAEIGVAEGKFSEVLCRANPNLDLLCVDPWHAYSGNPQKKSPEKDQFALNETKRRLAPYPNVKLNMRLSMDAVRDVADNSLDFVNIDGHHGFRFVMMDLLCWSTKVRSGGIILLDDYIFLDQSRWGAGVVEAVQAFTSANKINPWFVCNADRSVDAFFVKGDWK